ncbi:hypothetical protein ACFYT4_26445 [Streptomyces sp. NPDC004609]|uniref:hypothetical protein n=1 Tax=Streptomyces sp. NPDC004609 TaxID=3364704 RepID=UPI0036951A63
MTGSEGEAPDRAHAGWVVGGEFAEVSVSYDRSANGPRLRLEDLRTGRVRLVDALELETIVWLTEEQRHRMLDPSAGRWRDGAADV